MSSAYVVLPLLDVEDLLMTVCPLSTLRSLRLVSRRDTDIQDCRPGSESLAAPLCESIGERSHPEYVWAGRSQLR